MRVIGRRYANPMGCGEAGPGIHSIRISHGIGTS